jgi:ribosome biogenesis GTPase
VARRKLSQHQKKRIQGAQDAISSSDKGHIEGLVISHHGGKIIVEGDDAKLIECSVKSNLGTIVCGDRVVCEIMENAEFRVMAILPRKNFLQRTDGFGALKSVAANLTQILVCLSVKPEPNLYLLDQFLISAEQQDINPVIILNKIDLLPADIKDPFRLESIYSPLGYKVLFTSVKTGQGMDSLISLFDHHTTILSGVSGVGKSSITQALLPLAKIKIRDISDANEEGRHTTRTSRLYHLENGGDLIDTPGVRGFNPVLDPSSPISAGFREISDFSANCRFANCRHIKEPKCAVIAALSNGEIADTRYQHYLKMLNQIPP